MESPSTRLRHVFGDYREAGVLRITCDTEEAEITPNISGSTQMAGLPTYFCPTGTMHAT